MIESLSVTNFYCFKERTTILFTAKKERNRVLDNTFCGFLTQNKVNLLKLVYLLGNNGAGKSKILSAFKALKYLVTRIREGKDEPLRYNAFAFDDVCLTKPSIIELIYHIDNARFSYLIEWNHSAIYREVLKELRPRSEILLFQRWYDEDQDLVKFDFSSKMAISEDERYIICSSVLKNTSVISSINNTNISNSLLKSQFEFFKSGFEIVDLNDIDLSEELPDESTEHNQKLKKIISLFLQSVDTNIMNYEKLKVHVEYPVELLQKMKDLPEETQSNIRTFLRMDEEKHTVNTFHKVGKGGRNRLPLSAQSDGTKEILRLLITLNQAIENNKVIVLDDYSSGIQRNTLNQLLKFFIGSANGAQMIIATQDYSLLDFEVVRRDSIRFLVKDENAEAHVESINLSLLHKNSSLHHYVSKMNVYKQLPEMNDELFSDLLRLYKTL